MKLVYSDKFLEHNTGRNPECADRLRVVLEALKAAGLSEKDIVEPEPATSEELELVHEKDLIEEIELRAKRELSTSDNPFNRNTYELALLSAGAAFDAAKLCGKEFAFALERPPGHHAGIRTFGGFCYFNNIAFAVRKAQQELGYKKVLIIDFDVHLGQGTLEIFQDDPSVFYLSFHQNPNTIYPGRDFGLDKVSTKKIDFLPGTTDFAFLKRFEEGVVSVAKEFKPDLIGVSAGFDMFVADSELIGNRIALSNPVTFREMGEIVKSLGVPCFGVLEGGYALDSLGVLATNFIQPLF